MTYRKGLGYGKGMGYKNIIPTYDSHRHRLNAMGHKMPQRMSLMVCRGGKVPFPHDDINVANLPDENAVYVPSTNRAQKPISKAQFSKRVKETEGKLTELFGGFTRFQSYGGYKDDKGNIIGEKGAKVVSFATKRDAKDPEKLMQLKTWMLKKQKDWGQDSIGYEHEGDLYYLWAKKT